MLLLDEPLGALDLKLRRQMQIELKRIQTEVGITFVHVTHDQEEAMTMADTIAVMNDGRDRADGPARRALRPAGHHVRRQLPRPVQPGRGRRASAATATTSSSTRNGSQARRAGVRAPGVRRATVWVGRAPGEGAPRPQAARERRRPDNALPGGVVSDVSFIGVSTQYLVRMPWGQELTVFEQNSGAARQLRPGRAGRPHWAAEHTFLLDADQDAHAGDETYAQLVGAALEEAGVSVAQAGAPPAVHRSEPEAEPPRRRKSGTGYLLLLPGMLWLVLFFVVPTVQLVSTSLYNQDGSLETGYVMDWSFSNYLDVLQQYQDAVPALARLRRRSRR